MDLRVAQNSGKEPTSTLPDWKVRHEVSYSNCVDRVLSSGRIKQGGKSEIGGNFLSQKEPDRRNF